MFPDGLVTVDVVQYINGVTEDKILDRTVSSVLLYSRCAFITFSYPHRRDWWGGSVRPQKN